MKNKQETKCPRCEGEVNGEWNMCAWCGGTLKTTIKKCDVCGDNLYDVTTTSTLIGCEVELQDNGVYKHSEYNKVMKMFGKNKFSICFCCYLKALGLKPKVTK